MTTKCEVHGLELLPDHVERRGGMPPAPPGDYLETAERFFPNANSWVLGGCVIPFPEIETEEEVEYCPQCRKLEKSWWRAHRKDEFWTP